MSHSNSEHVTDAKHVQQLYETLINNLSLIKWSFLILITR